MPYYAVTIWGDNPYQPEIQKLKTKDEVIEWLLYEYTGHDTGGVFRTLKDAKQFCSEKIPNYKFKRAHIVQQVWEGIGW